VIETSRLLLRPPEPGYAIAVFRYMADPEVMRYLSPAGETRAFEDAIERIESWRRAWADDGFGPFVAIRRDTGTAIGRVGLLCWDPERWFAGTRKEIGDRAEVELGWILERAAWGHGYATEAAAAVRDWALQEVRPRRLISLIHPQNERSMRVAQKIGERYEHDVVTSGGVTVGLWSLASAT